MLCVVVDLMQNELPLDPPAFDGFHMAGPALPKHPVERLQMGDADHLL